MSFFTLTNYRKSVLIISVDTKERFDKTQHLSSLKMKSVGSSDRVLFCRIQGRGGE